MRQPRADTTGTPRAMTSPLSNKLRQLALGLTLWAMLGPAGMAQAAASPKDAEQDNTVRVYKKVAPTTVFITSANLGGNQIAGQMIAGATNAIGSGLLLDEQGLILTNAHVVEGATKISVTLYEGARLPAEIVGSDPITDLALLRVALPPGRHATAALGNSDQIEVGQKVLAIGHPFGLGYALTTGVISGFGSTPETATLIQDRVIQTSAAINPGNSGGPLVDTEGRVIGINAALLAGAQNIGFAIPINAAKSVMAELRTQGRVIRPWLGITGNPLRRHHQSVHAAAVQGIAGGRRRHRQPRRKDRPEGRRADRRRQRRPMDLGRGHPRRGERVRGQIARAIRHRVQKSEGWANDRPEDQA
ncbi:MAG: trypsin-like serine protease [Nitrospirae bacterium]|nr:MAG: trypsin-like serine protease [Nitrospirota bacterium]